MGWIYQVPHKELLERFWSAEDGLAHTIAIVKEHLIAFIYGRNDQLSKYIGCME